MFRNLADLHRPNRPFVRWSVVIRAVLAACAVALIAFAAWYVAVFGLPAWRRAREERAFESVELQRLIVRVVEIERFIHLPASTDP